MKIKAPIAQTTPRTADPPISVKLSDTMPGNLKRGSEPSIAINVRYETTAETSDGISASWAKSSLKGTSNANMIPVRGALKTAPIPAAAPARTNMRRSPKLRRRVPSLLQTHDPTTPPAYTEGPSCPALPPKPIVITAASIFFGNDHDDVSIFPSSSLYARITSSVPEPI